MLTIISNAARSVLKKGTIHRQMKIFGRLRLWVFDPNNVAILRKKSKDFEPEVVAFSSIRKL